MQVRSMSGICNQLGAARASKHIVLTQPIRWYNPREGTFCVEGHVVVPHGWSDMCRATLHNALLPDG